LSENSLQELKQHPRVLDLYRTRLSLKQDGRRWRGPCIWHSDKNPSLDVYQHEGTWIHHCMACNVSGSVIDCVQKADGVDFKQAVHIVREFCSAWAGDRARVETVFKPVSQEKASVKTYPEESYKAFESALQNSPAALTFLKSRGIDAPTAKRLRIGFRSDVGKLAGESGAKVSASGWITFPTFGDGNVTSIKYRSIVSKSFCKQPGMSTVLFNRETIDFLEPAFLVEGELDACVLEQAGFRAVSLPNATYQLTPADKDLLLSAEYVVLAGDNDDAGKKAMSRLFVDMKERTFWLRWPDGCKDANEYFLKKCSGDVSAFRTEIQKLVEVARSKPMEGVYDVRQSLLTASQSSSADNPYRLRAPWKSVDDMAIITPGTVTTIYSTDSGMGKTTLAFQWTLHAALKHNETVINYQAEMNQEQINTILASHLLRKDRLTLTEEDYHIAGKMLPPDLKYYIGRNTSFTNITEVLDLMEAAVRRFGGTVAVLDNLGFLCRNEHDPIKAQANAMQRITNMAGAYGLKWINLHQSRKADQNHKRKVNHVSDLDGSKAVQNDSSFVFNIHREEVKHTGDDAEYGTNEYDPLTDLRLQKVREKGPGKSFTRLLFLGGISTFSEVASVEEPNLFGGGQ
jgi:DNA primase